MAALDAETAAVDAETAALDRDGSGGLFVGGNRTRASRRQQSWTLMQLVGIACRDDVIGCRNGRGGFGLFDDGDRTRVPR